MWATTSRQTDAGKQTIRLYSNSLKSPLIVWIVTVEINATQRLLPRLLKEASSSGIKRLNSCVHGHQQVKWQGLTWLRHRSPLPGQAHTGHRSTEEHTERVLFCGPCAGQRRQVGVKWSASPEPQHRGRTVSTQLRHPLECNMGRQVTLSSPHTFIENLQIQGKPPSAVWHFGGNSDRERDLTGIKLNPGLVP